MATNRVLYAVAVSAACALATVTACDRDAAEAPPRSAPQAGSEEAVGFAHSLHEKVTVDNVVKHLSALQEIADKNNNTRAAGTAGFDQSVDYVVKALKDKGFDVQTPEFSFKYFQAKSLDLTVGLKKVDAGVLSYSPGGRVEGRLVPARAEESPGCTVEDYDGLDVKGAVVLVDRGSCPFADKERVAAERGAAAVIIADNVDENKTSGTLGEDSSPKIPVVSVTKSVGADLRAHPDKVVLNVDAETKDVKARNVIAQTKTGARTDVVMAGAHLDSVPEGPGINDNGTGTAAVLETALQLGPSPDVKNAVRFAFWGAEEEGLIGSTDYVKSLDVAALKNIALYLNYDMLGSPNAAYLTYDGDQSDEPDPNEVPVRIPEGSAGIERTEVAYLAEQGKKAHDTGYDGRSDYDAFSRAGIPTGGIFSGAEDKMSDEEAKQWGGKAGQPFDPNYHQAGDTLANVNKDALKINAGGVAYTVGLYAQSIDGRNGVPVHEDRTRHQLKG
ncbi:M28 family metallopeptidase [Mycobacteroides abscessus]|uniref:M28 family metallopeptidase n=1 Tax=Mycobacteroides abscessus TaxID=36809 RepID=UPI00092C0CAF|nr:M28 family metallopeptidase [Mycobacteroides abscessus]MDO3332086.1 M28 family metallopeptidase [Mycobacteroides abscessus subsp. bolletii]QSM88589.1 M28 family peptidase [Mycobacteroides abscessus subsp. bolletii]SIA77278.1 hydrolase [Mycobacteroides abscessus subsp. bolletii]SII87457.1 Probable lipoprotein aminopeptidase LpqL [Mycobacteroides abscessus subsp. bolletii]SIJ18765.1 Probable lipoprotein aminopeptidase LpqL [Mycobacteroides abscessus subsp. bolletii]